MGIDPDALDSEMDKDCRQRKIFECLLAVFKHDALKASQITRGFDIIFLPRPLVVYEAGARGQNAFPRK